MSDRLEKEIEKKVCEYAQKNGFLTPKLNVSGQRGWPDRLFIDPEGWHVYIEFKTPKGVLSKVQEYIHGLLFDRGVTILKVNDVDQGIEIVNKLVAARVPNKSN